MLKLNFGVTAMTLAFAVGLTSASVTVNAATITLTALDQGFYTADGTSPTSNRSYTVGQVEVDVGGLSRFEIRNWFIFDFSEFFDISPIPDTILGATLNLFNRAPDFGCATGCGYRSDDPTERYQIVGLTSPFNDIINGVGGTAAFDDLGSGTDYGKQLVGEDDVGIIEIELLAFALDDVNALIDGCSVFFHTCLFGIGGRLTTIDGPATQRIFANSGPGLQTLTLEFADPPPPPPGVVPLPAALPLYGTGLAVIGFLGWRRKRQAMRA